MSISKIIVVLFLFFSINSFTQNNVQLLTSQKGVSLRALSIPTKNVIWASGSKGTIVKSIDGGNNFQWMQVPGYEKRDFRAIHAFDKDQAIIVAIAAPAVILKTKDGGVSWQKVKELLDTNMFLDAIHFKDAANGWIIGDPINQQIFMLQTKDSGATWQEVKSYFTTSVQEGEAFFASSNSNMTHTQDALLMISGGKKSRLWINGNPTDIPIIQGLTTTGANSIAIAPDEKRMIIVGGDFAKDTLMKDNVVLFTRKGQKANRLKQWKMINRVQNPHGYKSCVEYISNDILLSCGTSGIDISKNGGRNWQVVDKQGFHVVKKIPNFNSAILAGSGGRIAIIHVP